MSESHHEFAYQFRAWDHFSRFPPSSSTSDDPGPGVSLAVLQSQCRVRYCSKHYKELVVVGLPPNCPTRLQLWCQRQMSCFKAEHWMAREH